ncbi:hypothetical protein LJC60_05970, partial [Ruminococcaceae bacterium OttesenSCG-928-D13]|nr:hypothetical protein [Ruminococcaceae bacterium OttesenSCG-928-D13]
MNRSWQTKLAAFAKRHPALKVPVFLLLWAGFKLSAAAEACGRKWGDSWDGRPAGHHSWRLRVLSFTMALLVGFAALPAARYHAEEAPLPEFSLTDEDEAPPAENQDETDAPEAGADDGSDDADGSDAGDSSEIDDGESDDTSNPGDDSGSDEDGGGDDSSGGEDDGEADSGTDAPSEAPDNGDKNVDDQPILVTGFPELDGAVLVQEHPLGTTLEELLLPETLDVTLGGAAAEAEAADGAKLADGQSGQAPDPSAGSAEPKVFSLPKKTGGEDSAGAAEKKNDGYESIPVGWLAQPEYDAKKAYTYTFTPVLPEGMALAEGVVLPAVIVVLGGTEMQPTASLVYVKSGGTGNGDETNPFGTLKDAVAALATSGGTVVLLSDLTGQPNVAAFSNAAITITSKDSNKYKVTRGETGAPFLQVGGGASLRLENVTLDGNDLTSTLQSPLVRTFPDSVSLELNNAALQNNGNMVASGNTTGGGAIFATESKVTMTNGSTISNNKAVRGGGIYLDQMATLIIEDGCSISNNTATNGGGVALGMDGRLTLAGGSITGNNASDHGKDVYLDGSVDPVLLSIISGTIGSPGASGGGLYVTTAASGAAQVQIHKDFSLSSTIYVDKAFEAGSSTYGAPIATFASNFPAGGRRYLAAARFIGPSSTRGLAVGTVVSGFVRIVSDMPVKLHFYEEGHASYEPAYLESLQVALDNALADGSGRVAYISLRDDLSGSESAITDGKLRNGVTVLRSEDNTKGSGGTSKIFKLDYGNADFGFKVDAGQTLTIDNVVVDDKSTNGAAVKVTGGIFNLNAAGKIATARGGATVTGGAFNQYGALSLSSISPAVVVSGGSYTLYSGTVSGGSGITVSGTGAMGMEGGSITGATNGVSVIDGRTFTMSGGTISGSGQAGVQLSGSGKLALSGGAVITGNNSYGVEVQGAPNGGILEMSGGTISGHTKTPGLYVAGTATITAGTISGNGKTGSTDGTDSGVGAGILVAGGTLGITGTTATITGSATNGIYLSSGTLNMADGTISSNANGSGLRAVGGTLNLSGNAAITGNKAANGAGLYVESGVSALNITGGAITGNEASASGGGIYLDKAATLAGLSVESNKAANGGGIYLNKDATLTSVTVTGNEATANGGGIYANSSLSLPLASGVTVTDNEAAAKGGGIYSAAGLLELKSGTIDSSTAPNRAVDGGGIYVAGAGIGAGFSMTGGTVAGNTATNDGGGVYLAGGTQSLTGGSIQGNRADADGGGLYSAATSGTLALGGVTIGGAVQADGNTALNGGGVYVLNGTVTVSGSTAIGFNSASADGGGLYLENGDLSVGGSFFDDNEAGGNGGGLFVKAGAFAANGGNFRRNTAVNGGGVYTQVNVGFTDTLFDENEATGAGGGLYVKSASAKASLKSGTLFTQNTAPGRDGTAIYLDGGSLELDGGQVGGDLQAGDASGVGRTNGVGRAGSEKIHPGSNFDSDIRVMLEQTSAPYEKGHPIYSQTQPPVPPACLDWLVPGEFTALSLTEKQAAGSFWTAGLDTGKNEILLMRGAWVAGSNSDNKIVFEPATIKVYYPDTDETEFAASLDDAFILINSSGQAEAEIISGSDLEAAAVTVMGAAKITLKPDTENASTGLTIKHTGTGDLFTMAANHATSLYFNKVTVRDDRTTSTGSLFNVSKGTLVLNSGITLVSKSANMTLVTASGNGGSGNKGGIIQVNQPALTSSADVNFKLSGNAQIQLTKGMLGAVSCTGSATIYFANAFDGVDTAVHIADNSVPKDELSFIELESGVLRPELKTVVAGCFTGQTSTGVQLIAGVTADPDNLSEEIIIWQAIEVRLQVGSDPPEDHISLTAAFNAIPPNTNKAVTITVLQDITTPKQTVPDNINLTIQPPAAGTKTITRETGITGDLFTVKSGARLTLAQNLVVDGGGAANAGGALVAVESGGSLTLSGTLQNNHGVNGGAVRNNGGTVALDANALISGNTATRGGGIHNSGTLTLTDGAIADNSATDEGGGVYQAGGGVSFAMTGGKITGNGIGTSASPDINAAGSGVHIQSGSINLDGAPAIGSHILDNNLYMASSALIGIGMAYTSAASVHVADSAAYLQKLVAQRGDSNVTAPQAATFRHVGTQRYIGGVYSQNNKQVAWGEPRIYPVHSWDATGTKFTCDGDWDKLLYLMVDDKLMPANAYTATGTAGNPTKFELKPAVIGQPADADVGYVVLAVYTDGYGEGAANSIGLTIEGGSETFYTTLELALKDVPANANATIKLYSTTVVTDETDNHRLTIEDGRHITLTSGDRAGGSATHSALRGANTAGDLFTVGGSGSAASLTLENVIVDGCKATAASQNGSLARVNAKGTLTLGTDAELKNNATTGNGGAVYLNGGALDLDGGILAGNAAALGGGIYAPSGAITGLAGTVNGANGTTTANTATKGGAGIWIKPGATFTVTAGAYDGIVLSNAASDGNLPATPLITLAKGFNSGITTSLKLEGVASAGATATVSVPKEKLVALYAGDFEDTASLKRAAARRISHAGLRGIPMGAGVVLAEADSVEVHVQGSTPETFATLEEAFEEVPPGATATITLLNAVVVSARIVVDGGSTITLTTRSTSVNFTARRGQGLLGHLITLKGGSSLTIKGNDSTETVIDGYAIATTNAKGSLIYVEKGSLTIAAGGGLQNNATDGNGGAVYATSEGTLRMTGGTVQLNEAANGGGIYTEGPFTLSGGTITSNTASGNGNGVYLAQPAAMELLGGTIGESGTGNDLFQEAATGQGAVTPALTVAGPLTAGTDRENLAGWRVAGATKPYLDDDRVALFGDDQSLTYQARLDTAPQLEYIGGDKSLYAVLDPKAESILLREYIKYTEPLYLEAAINLGSDVNWTLVAGTGTVTGIEVEGKALSAGDFTGGTDTASLSKAFLDSLENGTYTAVLITSNPGAAGRITTGFTVQGNVTVMLEVPGKPDQGFRTLAGAVAAAPNEAAKIRLLQDVEVTEPITVGASRNITVYSNTSPVKTVTRKAAGDLFTVETGAALAFSSLILDGNSTGYSPAGGALVRVAGGALTLQSGAVLSGNSNAAGPGAVSVTGGSFTMAGGTITANSGTTGGGVAVSGDGSFVQQGGAITENTASTGGGVYL